MKYVVATFCLLVVSVPASAHHSRAEFANEMRELEGVITRVMWRNPHIALFIDVVGDDGRTTSWRIEGPTRPAALEQAGVAATLFAVGDRVSAFGQPSSYRDALLATNVLLENGTEVLMESDVARRWTGPVVGDSQAPAPQLADAGADDRGLFRAWYPVGNPMRQMMRFPFTDRAVAARADWDPVENPIVECEQPGLPGTLFHPRPIEFSRDGDDIVLHHSYFDTRRTIHMSANADAPASHLGFSLGRWEGERTLVVDTASVDYPYFDNRGTGQGPDLKITERYTLSEDQTRLDLSLAIEDPIALTEPISAEWHFLALDAPFEAYECNVF